MRKNNKIRVIIAIAAVLVCGVMGASMTAYAADIPGTDIETETEPDSDGDNFSFCTAWLGRD